jgi:hypothetical protein
MEDVEASAILKWWHPSPDSTQVMVITHEVQTEQKNPKSFSKIKFPIQNQLSRTPGSLWSYEN